MLQLSKRFYDQAVLSLRTGGPIATALKPILNPNNLKIEGFFCQDRFSKKQLILLEQDIRDFMKQGIVVNDHEVLADPEELVRLKEVMETDFQLIGKPVYTTSKQKVGKVGDFAAEVPSLYIKKLYVNQPLLKSLSGGSLSVDRNDIVEITDRRVIINDILRPTPATAPAPAPAQPS